MLFRRPKKNRDYFKRISPKCVNDVQKEMRKVNFFKQFVPALQYAALKWLLHKKHIQGTRLARWFYLIQDRDFTIIHRAGKLHAQVDALSRPVLPIRVVDTNEDDHNASVKNIDPYEDYALLYYLEFRKFQPGTGSNQSKRIKRAAEHYKIENDILK